MRLEKGFLHWKADILTEFDPFETGLGRFVKMDKPDFVGKTALADRIAAGQSRKLVTLDVDCAHAPAHGGASVVLDGSVVGTVTSGAFGHRVGKNLAYAFVKPDLAVPDTGVEVEVLGDRVAARVIEMSPYDPAHERIRA